MNRKKIITTIILSALMVIAMIVPSQSVAADPSSIIAVTLQGTERPDTGWVIPLTVKVFTTGANVLIDTPLYTFTQDTTKVYNSALVQLDIPDGIYDITVKSNHTLMNVKRNVEVPSVIDLGTLLEGNAKENTPANANSINLSDVITVSASWLKSVGDVGFNPNCDFDINGVVNQFDLDLLRSNWNKRAPIIVQ